MKIIKKYANRKLYDTQLSRYITLDKILKYVLNEYDFVIINNKTKEDETTQTLREVMHRHVYIDETTCREMINNYYSDDYDPSPWCSYGHKTKESCDCGPIAEND